MTLPWSVISIVSPFSTAISSISLMRFINSCFATVIILPREFPGKYNCQVCRLIRGFRLFAVAPYPNSLKEYSIDARLPHMWHLQYAVLDQQPLQLLPTLTYRLGA